MTPDKLPHVITLQSESFSKFAPERAAADVVDLPSWLPASVRAEYPKGLPSGGLKSAALARFLVSLDVKTEVLDQSTPAEFSAIHKSVSYMIFVHVLIVERIMSNKEREQWLTEIAETAGRLSRLIARCKSVDYEDARSLYPRYTPQAGPVEIDGREYAMVDPRYVVDALARAALDRAKASPRCAGFELSRQSTGYRTAMIKKISQIVRKITGKPNNKMVAAIARAVMDDVGIDDQTVKDATKGELGTKTLAEFPPVHKARHRTLFLHRN